MFLFSFSLAVRLAEKHNDVVDFSIDPKHEVWVHYLNLMLKDTL